MLPTFRGVPLNPYPTMLFADHHAVISALSILYKKVLGRGHFRLSGTCPQSPVPSLLNYLLMSSFASSRFSKGWRNVFVASGAPLIAIVISFAAFGKSPVFDEIRASAKWLIQ